MWQKYMIIIYIYYMIIIIIKYKHNIIYICKYLYIIYIIYWVSIIIYVLMIYSTLHCLRRKTFDHCLFRSHRTLPRRSPSLSSPHRIARVQAPSASCSLNLLTKPEWNPIPTVMWGDPKPETGVCTVWRVGLFFLSLSSTSHKFNCSWRPGGLWTRCMWPRWSRNMMTSRPTRREVQLYLSVVVGAGCHHLSWQRSWRAGSRFL